jgi:hypothetical protein
LLLFFSAAIGQPFNGTVTTWDEATESWFFPHGKVFVYTRSSDGTWIDEPQVLVTNDKAYGDYFGDSIAISGNRMIVGASEKYSNKLNTDGSCCDQRGKVYAFVKVGDSWEQDGEPLLPDDEVTDPKFHFGAYVALDEDTALVGHDSDTWGHIWDEETQTSTLVNQIVHVFSRSAGGWQQTHKLSSSKMGKDPDEEYWHWGFGRGVELQGDRALIWDGGNQAVLLENWEYVETEYIFGAPNALCWRCGRIALSSDAIFFGANPYGNEPQPGSVFVLDNHSVLPVCPFAIFDSTLHLLFSFPHL